MKFSTYTLLLLAFWSCTGCTTGAKFGLSNASVSATSENAIVVIKTNSFAREFYSLSFDQYDSEKASFLNENFRLNFLLENNGYIFANAEPGEYTLSRITVDQNWNLCPHERTVSLTVLPGKVNFVGVHDPKPFQRHSAEAARNAGHESLDQYSSVYYVDEIPEVTMREPIRSEVRILQKLIQDNLPSITAPVIVSEISYASYRKPAENKLFGMTCTSE